MESDAQTLLALHCLKDINNTSKSNHVSSSFLIFYVLFYIYLWSCTNFLTSLIFSAPLDLNLITDLDKFVNRFGQVFFILFICLYGVILNQAVQGYVQCAILLASSEYYFYHYFYVQ